MTLTINPCRACREKHQDDCNINTINDCVAETAAAFAGIPNNSVVEGTPSGANWYGCMSDLMTSQGRDFTNLRLDVAPVFVQTPHHFPHLLASNGGDKAAALRACKEACATSRSNSVCQEHCVTDHNAVDVLKNSPKPCAPVPRGGVPQALPSLWDAANCDPRSKENYTALSQGSPSPPPTPQKPMKLSVGFWIGFVLVAIALSFVLAVFLPTLYTPNLNQSGK